MTHPRTPSLQFRWKGWRERRRGKRERENQDVDEGHCPKRLRELRKQRELGTQTQREESEGTAPGEEAMVSHLKTSGPHPAT